MTGSCIVLSLDLAGEHSGSSGCHLEKVALGQGHLPRSGAAFIQCAAPQLSPMSGSNGCHSHVQATDITAPTGRELTASLVSHCASLAISTFPAQRPQPPGTKGTSRVPALSMFPADHHHTLSSSGSSSDSWAGSWMGMSLLVRQL